MVVGQIPPVSLQSPIRVLIVDDDAKDQRKAQNVFEGIGVPAEYTFASTYKEGVNLICHRYFDIAVLDLVLHGEVPGPRETWEGFWILQELAAQNLDQGIAVIVSTAFGSSDVAIEAFKGFHVLDLWDKHKTTAEQKLLSLQNALTRLRYFNLACRVEFEGDLTWKNLVADLDLPVSVDRNDGETELKHLLPGLFPEADGLSLARIPAGASSAKVLRVTPFYGNSRGADVVVKYGPLDEIRLELKGWEKIRRFVGDHRYTQIEGFVPGRQLAAIKYTLVGAEPGKVVVFSDYYALEGDVGRINGTLRKLFAGTCRLWYGDIRVGPTHSNLEDAYSRYLGFTRENIATAYKFKFADQPLAELISYPGLPRQLPNPVMAYLSEDTDFHRAHSRAHTFCLTHGDLHGRNILVDKESGDPWLIDFRHSGQGHWARDFVLLETVIKFQLTPSADVSELYELEYELSIAESLDGEISLMFPDSGLGKAFQCVAGLRQTAANLISHKLSSKAAMLDYNVALYYQTLNYIRRHSLIKQRHRKNHVLISAALLYERILIQQRTSSQD